MATGGEDGKQGDSIMMRSVTGRGNLSITSSSLRETMVVLAGMDGNAIPTEAESPIPGYIMMS